MSIAGERYTISFDALDQQVNFDGVLRTVNKADLTAVKDYLVETQAKQGHATGSCRRSSRCCWSPVAWPRMSWGRGCETTGFIPSTSAYGNKRCEKR